MAVSKKMPSITNPQNMSVNDWKDTFRKYLNKRLEPHKPLKPFVAPRLKCTSILAPEIPYVAVGDSIMVTVTVTNRGNGISFASYIAVYDGPSFPPPNFFPPYNRIPEPHISELKLCDYKIMTIIPGQTVEAKLRWQGSSFKGSIIGICFDPFYDQRGFDYVNSGVLHDHIIIKDYELFLFRPGC